jgi:transposase
MIIDVALSKYCDLIPIDRYKSIAGRAGLKDIPPQSLIQLTHDLADFLSLLIKRIKLEVLDAKVLHADETPHRMLEAK